MNIIQCNKRTTNITTSAHAHGEWEIQQILSGTETAIIDGITYSINENDVMVIPPGAMHQEFPHGDFLAISLTAKELPFSGVTTVNDYDKDIATLFELVLKVMTEREFDYGIIADSLIDTMSRFIKKYAKANCKHTFTVELKNQLYENISNSDFNISDAILKMGFNLDYFRRCFKEDFGTTPHEHLTDMRIDLAKKTLRDDVILSIERIAYLCGYNDSFYFSKVFKKHTGLTPRDYRKKHMNL